MLKIDFKSPTILNNATIARPVIVNSESCKQYNQVDYGNIFYHPVHISFKSSQKMKSEKYLGAKEYLKSCNIDKEKNIYDLDLDKLDGIQEGLKTFSGLNMKEIALILKNIEIITVKRGCKNHCAHCLFESETPLRNTKNQASKASFEDFAQLMSDIKHLNKRLGFNIIVPNKTNDNQDIILFLDSDSIDCNLIDSKGIEYNFAELNHMQYLATAKPGTFDTHGWELDDKKSQKRAEKIIEYFKDDKNADEIYQINISVNPFHEKMQEAVEAQKCGDSEKALKKVNEYVERMANVLYTFTPIIDKIKLSVRVANMNDEGIFEEARSFDIENQIVINRLIKRKLAELYLGDLWGDKKYVSSEAAVMKNITSWDSMLNKIYGATPKGRMSRYYENSNDLQRRIKDAENIKDAFLDNDKNKLKRISGLLDINGKFYIFSDPAICPTELQLNYTNKNKMTRDLSLGLPSKCTITKELINSLEFCP